MLVHIAPEDFASHILNLIGGKKSDCRTVADALRRYQDYTAELVMAGVHLTSAQKDAWRRDSESSGL